MPKVKLSSRHTTSFDSSTYFVPPPGRGTVSRPITVRVAPELADAVEHMLHARPEGKDEPYFNKALYRNQSDLYRALIHQGLIYFRGVINDEDLDREGDILAQVQRSNAVAAVMAVMRHTAEQIDQSLTALMSAGALEEAKRLWSEQRLYSDRLEGYSRKVMDAVLVKYPNLMEPQHREKALVTGGVVKKTR